MVFIQAIFFSFTALFPIVNPMGAAIIFLTLVKGSSPQQINILATKISIYAVIMLLIVLFVGSWILSIFGVTVPIVLISGGLLLAQVGWQMLNQSKDTELSLPTKQEKKPGEIEKFTDPRAFYPLTLPVTAGPTCIAITIALGAHSIAQATWKMKSMALLGNSIGIVLIGLSIFFCYRYSHYLFDKLKDTGRNVAMSLAAFINICIGLQITWRGLAMLIPK
jgi:multiple antibiotic resistance protein